VPVVNLSGSKDSELVYFIEVAGSNKEVAVKMSSGTGDADLYVKSGIEPTKDNYDCRPFEGGNNESCNIAVSLADTIYVKLIGYSAFDGVELVATISDGNTDEFPQNNLSASRGYWLRYSYTVPAGVSKINVKTSSGSGDADLYVKNNLAPSKNTYDCRPYKSGNNESCSIIVNAGDEVHIGIFAYSNFSGLTLNVLK
jgi:hypothetical protein